MTGDLIINSVDAYTTWGINMGDGFLGAILSPPPLKDCIENKSRSNNGKTIVSDDPKLDERSVTLVLNLEGNSQSDFLTKLKSFYTELAKRNINIKVPLLGTEVYKLVYQKSTQFAMNTSRTFTKISIQFNEPNPADRT